MRIYSLKKKYVCASGCNHFKLESIYYNVDSEVCPSCGGGYKLGLAMVFRWLPFIKLGVVKDKEDLGL